MINKHATSANVRRFGMKCLLASIAVVHACQATAANAGIIYSGRLNQSIHVSPDGFVLDLIPLDAANEFGIASNVDSVWIDFYGAIRGIPSTQPDEWLADGFYLKKLDEGAAIGTGAELQDYYSMIQSPYSESEWTGSEGYFGFEYNPTGSQPLYGWGRLNLTPDNSVLTFVDWAYENSGAAIRAGQVPEPGTAMLLASGFLGLGCRRRRITVST
jgi:hypothetical protein